MSLALVPLKLAIAKNLTYPFSGTGGTEPYVYSVLPNGVGGSINSSSGSYTSPDDFGVDIVQVMDATGDIATTQVQVCSPIQLLCEIIQSEMDLDDGRVYLWDQKIFEPTDQDLFVVVGIISSKPFSNTNTFNSAGNQVQSINMMEQVTIDILSRGPEARDRKEEVLMALNSVYAQQQQALNSFRVFGVPISFLNISQVDGAAIPYRFTITVGMQYFVKKTKASAYYNNFEDTEVITDP